MKETDDYELYDFNELFESLEAEVEKMKAIEILEWRDKNLLAGTMSSRREQAHERFSFMLDRLNILKKKVRHETRGIRAAKNVGIVEE